MTDIPSIAAYPIPRSEKLPINIAKWEIDPERAVLLIHDMQQYFLRPLHQQIYQTLIQNISSLRNYAVKNNIPVCYSAQPGGMSDKQRGLLKDFWGSGMKVTPDDRKFPAELSPTSEDWLITKWRYSAFFRSNLLERMKETKRDQLIICGVYAHVGILMTAVDAFTNDIQPFIVADATADFSEQDHWMALEYAAQRCASVSTVEEVVQ